MAFKIWASVPLLLFVIDLLRRWLFGPPAPPNLSRQLVIAAMCALVLFLGFPLNLLFDSKEFQDSPVTWVVLFLGFALLAWLVSAYSLVVNYIFGLYGQKL